MGPGMDHDPDEFGVLDIAGLDVRRRAVRGLQRAGRGPPPRPLIRRGAEGGDFPRDVPALRASPPCQRSWCFAWCSRSPSSGSRCCCCSRRLTWRWFSSGRWWRPTCREEGRVRGRPLTRGERDGRSRRGPYPRGGVPDPRPRRAHALRLCPLRAGASILALVSRRRSGPILTTAWRPARRVNATGGGYPARGSRVLGAGAERVKNGLSLVLGRYA